MPLPPSANPERESPRGPGEPHHPPLATVEWDSAGRVSRWTPEAEALFGWKAEEVMGKRISEWPFVHPGDAEAVRRMEGELQRQRQTFSANRNLARDGRVLFCEWYNTAVTDGDGRFQAHLSLVLDVTARVQAREEAEAARREAERAADRIRRLQTLTAALSEALTPAQVAHAVMDQGIAVLGADAGVIVLVEEDGRHLTLVDQRGYEEARVRGWERFPLSSPLPIAEAVRTGEVVILATEEERVRRYPHLAGSGVQYPASISVPLVVEGERLGAMGLSFRDPHSFGEEDRAFLLSLARQCAQAVRRAGLYEAERRARAATEAGERHFRTMVETIPQLAWMAGADGRIVWFNQRWYDYTGTTPEQMRGWGWRQAHHPEHLARVEEGLRRSFGSGQAWEDTFPLRGRGGEYRRFLSRALPLRDDEGRVVRWFGTNTDVEDQLRAEEARERALAEAERARVAAEEANRSKSSFLATMSHEIRTPINAVIGYTDLLDLELQGPLTDGQRQYLSRIRASGQHLLGLVSDVLDFAKVEAGQMLFVAERVPLGAVAAEALSMVAPQAAAGEVEVEHGRCDLGVFCLGDPDRVRQIVLNLLSNAAKFTRRGGRITVRCGERDDAPATALLTGPGPWAFLEVEDTGIGIAPEHQARIFEPFRQVDESHTREAGGTGLGLAISRRFARLMGGDLSVRSRVGEGSVFTLWIPRVEQKVLNPES